MYGVSAMSHSSNVITDTNLKNAEITAKLITIRDGFYMLIQIVHM